MLFVLAIVSIELFSCIPKRFFLRKMFTFAIDKTKTQKNSSDYGNHVLLWMKINKK